MARLDMVGGEVRVRFSAWERLAVWREDVVVPPAAIRAVEYVESPVGRARGGRAGVLVSGVLKVGFWGLGTGVRQLVSVRRGVPAVRVEVDRAASGLHFDELLISTPNAVEVADALAVRV
ncbi:hypothetical protein [Amycolatopsis pittospori]|uniref:hypothetical protein n=1 Tax=Amycolatopsis pittospori TaxID=2749434 RepID=UPI0015EFE4FF|nr:hypothetical protein [Amycolatopsis pittospori]